MASKRTSAAGVSALTIALALPAPAGAIVVDISRLNASSVAPNAFSDRYGGVGYVTTNCSGVAITRGAVLSAAHCFEGNEGEFRLPIDGRAEFRSTASVEKHPDFDGSVTSPGDLAIMRLDTLLPAGTPLYTIANLNSPPLGEAVELVGFGFTGTGITGEQPLAPGTFGEVKRFGFNEVDGIVNGGATLTLDFDGGGENHQGSAGLGALESFVAFGDSGGPILLGGKPGPGLTVGSQEWLDAVFADPPLLLGLSSYSVRFGSGPFGRFGSVAGHTNLAEFSDWIAERAPGARFETQWPVPVPAPLILLVSAIGLLAPFLNRRKRG